MKNLTTAIFSKLAGSLLYTDIGGRLFKGRAPEGTVYPYAVFFLVSDMPDKTFTEDYEDCIIQFSLFSEASSSGEIEDMFTHLKTLYDEKPMTIKGSTLVWMKRQNASLMMEEHTTPNGTVDVWHYAVDFNVLLSLTE